MSRLNPKQFNIANGPQGTRWGPELVNHDDRWRSMAVREHGRAYAEDVTKTHIAAEEGRTANTSYFPGQGTSQGKLFHDPKPIDPHRWPRGYTPERQSDVAASFQPWGRPHPRETALVAKARDTIARSDMPESDLARVSKGFESPVAVTDQPGAGGTYDEGKRRITLHPDAGDTTTMHEVGHAVSAARGLPGMVGDERVARDWHEAWHQGGETFARVAGAEEARADIYARHTRQKDGAPDLRQSDYRPSDDYLRAMNRGGGDAEPTFYKEYGAEHGRQGVARPSQAALDAAKVRQAEALRAMLTDTKPSPHLFQRRDMYSSGSPGMDSHIPLPTEPDYGQYRPQTPEGEDLGTIPVGGGLPAHIRESVVKRQEMIARIDEERRGRR